MPRRSAQRSMHERETSFRRSSRPSRRASRRGRAGRGSWPRRRYHHRFASSRRRRKAKRQSCAQARGDRGTRSRRGCVQGARSTGTLQADRDDGGKVAAGGVVAEISGKTRALLTGERTALNFLGHLSGIATLTAVLCRGGGRHQSPHRLHAQDDAWPARLGEIRGAMRRRRQSSLRAL